MFIIYHRLWCFSSFLLQQQSAKYFSPHERNNASPTAGNLTVLNSAAHCFPPTTENLLNRPSCLTCPTISEHCDHPTASTVPPHPSHFHPFHHSNMHGPQQLLATNKNLMANQHPIFDSCQKWANRPSPYIRFLLTNFQFWSWKHRAKSEWQLGGEQQQLFRLLQRVCQEGDHHTTQ